MGKNTALHDQVNAIDLVTFTSRVELAYLHILQRTRHRGGARGGDCGSHDFILSPGGDDAHAT